MYFKIFARIHSPALTLLFGSTFWPRCAKSVMHMILFLPQKIPSILYQSQSSRLNVFISRKMKANTFFCSSLICAKPPFPDHCIQTVTQESPVSSLNSSQTAEEAKVNRVSGEPANSLSVSPACLSHRSMWAQGHLVFSLGLAPCAPSNLCLSMGAPWRRKLLRIVSGKGGGEPRCKAWCWSAVTELD